MQDQQQCIFCDIVHGRSPATFVYRDELCSAFLDIQPVNAGHTLVIPNDHDAFLADLDESRGGHMFTVGQRVAAALRRSEIPCEGVNMFLADGAAAMQDVFHVHLHIIPRFSGDGFGLTFGPRYGERPARADLEAVGLTLRRAM